jgi:hypothetical protein
VAKPLVCFVRSASLDVLTISFGLMRFALTNRTARASPSDRKSWVTYTGASELVATCLGAPDLEELSNTTLDVATHSPRYLPVPALHFLKRAAAEATTTFEEVNQEDGWVSAEH